MRIVAAILDDLGKWKRHGDSCGTSHVVSAGLIRVVDGGILGAESNECTEDTAAQEQLVS